MYNYKMTIAYDGGRYDGWQKQGNTKNTIEEKIEDVLSKLLDEEVEIMASGRTDAGVHAIAQVANFKTKQMLEEKQFLEYMNRYLPKDIRIYAMEKVDERFHSRLSAKRKTYVYRIDNTEYGTLFDRKYAMRFATKLDVNLMKKAAAFYVGEHDFKSFCTKKNMKKSTVRTIYGVDINENNGIIEISYTGNGFLYNMVRILTGTLIEVGRGTINAEDVPDIIAKRHRGAAGFTAEPEGLFLKEVEY